MNRRMIEGRPQGVGVGTGSEDEWESLTVTWGAEKFAPVQYHSFDMGPLSVTVASEPGLTLAEAHARALAHLKQMAEAQFNEQVVAFAERVKLSAAAVRGGR